MVELADAADVQLPAEFIDEAHQLVAEGFEYWRENATQAQKDLGTAEVDMMMNQPAMMEQHMLQIA